jgi:hypothetical protein
MDALKTFRRTLVCVLALALFCATSGTATIVAQQKQDAKTEQRTEKIKRKVFARGTGTKARAGVKLNDGAKLKGYIAEATPDNFTLIRTDERAGTSVKINYSDVAELKAHGKGLSTTSKVLIVTGAGVGLAVGALALMFRNLGSIR